MPRPYAEISVVFLSERSFSPKRRNPQPQNHNPVMHTKNQDFTILQFSIRVSVKEFAQIILI